MIQQQPATRIAIIGAGIVGCVSAFRLQQQGFEVVLYDQGQPGERGPSRGNAGHIAGSDIFPISEPGIALTGLRMLADRKAPLKISLPHAPALLPWLMAFIRAGSGETRRQAIAAISVISDDAVGAMEQLFADAGMADFLTRIPCLYVYDTLQSFNAARSGWAAKARAGKKSQELSRAELQQIEPDLADRFAGAVMSYDWAQVSEPLDVVKGIFTAARRKGAAFENSKVAGIESSPAGMVVHTASGAQLFDRIVVAAGVWSRALAAEFGDRLPVESERGYNITYPDPGIKVGHPIVFADHGIVSTSLASGLRIGGWAVFGGIKDQQNEQYFATIEAMGRRFFPGLNPARGFQWSGQRPTLPDSVPIISRSPHEPRLIYATGHGHYGLSWSARTAQLVAELVKDHDAAAAAFSLLRFRQA